MRLLVNHSTAYQFSMPQRRLIQLLRLTPSNNAGQQVTGWDINVECDARLIPNVDGFGNECTMLYIDGPIDRFMLTVVGEVFTEDRQGIVEGANEPLPTMAYLRSTPMTQPTRAIMDFAGSIAAAEKDGLARMHRLMDALNSQIRFDLDDTHVHRDAGEAFAEGSGVCQDHAHIFVTAARAMDIPARYVSGHLYRRDNESFQTATHAWAEAFISDLGWVGFDPANNISPDDAYIRVATGLDYRDAAPLSGARSGGGTETLAVGVSVTQAQAQFQN